MDDSARRRGGLAQAALLVLASATLAACAGGPEPQVAEPLAGRGTDRPYQVNGVWYYPRRQPDYDEIGIASWYGPQFQHRPTADGEMFDMNRPSAAHKTLPLPCLVEVTNLANGRRVVVRVNDRGPFVGGRVIDLSRAAANELGFVAEGVTKVRVRYVGQPEEAPAPSRPLADQTLVSAPRRPGPAALARPLTLTALPAPSARPEPNAPPSPVVLAANSPTVAALPAVTAVVVSPVPTTAIPPAPLAVAALAPDAAAPPLVPPAPPVVVAASGRTYQVQAGVFASAVTAQRIAAALQGPGSAQVQPLPHAGHTLYRVIVHGLADAAAAEAVRSRAATLGVVDARAIAAVGA